MRCEACPWSPSQGSHTYPCGAGIVRTDVKEVLSAKRASCACAHVYVYLCGCACRIVAAPIAFSRHAIDSCTGVCMCYCVSPVSTRAFQRDQCESKANIVTTCGPTETPCGTYVSSPNAYHSHTLLRILGRVTLRHSSCASWLCLRGTHSAE